MNYVRMDGWPYAPSIPDTSKMWDWGIQGWDVGSYPVYQPITITETVTMRRQYRTPYRLGRYTPARETEDS